MTRGRITCKVEAIEVLGEGPNLPASPRHTDTHVDTADVQDVSYFHAEDLKVEPCRGTSSHGGLCPDTECDQSGQSSSLQEAVSGHQRPIPQPYFLNVSGYHRPIPPPNHRACQARRRCLTTLGMMTPKAPRDSCHSTARQGQTSYCTTRAAPITRIHSLFPPCIEMPLCVHLDVMPTSRCISLRCRRHPLHKISHADPRPKVAIACPF